MKELLAASAILMLFSCSDKEKKSAATSEDAAYTIDTTNLMTNNVEQELMPADETNTPVADSTASTVTSVVDSMAVPVMTDTMRAD